MKTLPYYQDAECLVELANEHLKFKTFDSDLLIDALIDELKTKIDEFDDNDKKIDKLESDIESKDEEIEYLTDDLRQEKESVEEHKAWLNEKIVECEDLQAEVTRLQQIIDSSNVTMAHTL